MKTIRTALMSLALLALLSQCARCQWQEQRITTGHTWFTGATLLWEDKIYWTDRRSGYGEIYVWDQAGGERRLIGGDGVSRGSAAIWGDQMIVSRYVGGQRDLYLWDAANGERLITAASGNQLSPAMSDKLVTWEDYRSGTPQIYVWDPVSGERRISPTSADQTNPEVWGDTVVWEDTRNGRFDAYMWNPRDGERRLSTHIIGMCSPAIYQDRVVMWGLTTNPALRSDMGLWEWTPQNGLKQLAQRYCDSWYSTQNTMLWGDHVAWAYGNGNGISSIGAWDPANGFTWVPQGSFSYFGGPSIYGNKVAWIGNNDIYLSTLVPEPSGMLALLGRTGMLGILIRRKR